MNWFKRIWENFNALDNFLKTVQSVVVYVQAFTWLTSRYGSTIGATWWCSGHNWQEKPWNTLIQIYWAYKPSCGYLLKNRCAIFVHHFLKHKLYELQYLKWNYSAKMHYISSWKILRNMLDSWQQSLNKYINSKMITLKISNQNV